jgi:hypothetical protein
MNFTGESRNISLDLTSAGITSATVKTLAADDASLNSTTTLKNVTLPPYASWVAAVK